MAAPKNTFKFIQIDDNTMHVMVSNDCLFRTPFLLAIVHDCMTINPTWRFCIDFGMNGMIQAFEEFLLWRQEKL